MNKQTKIICTIGPASWSSDVMRGMIEAGMNCARVNGAFADPDELDKVAKLVRDVSDSVSLMLDVKGPEIRLNKFAKEIPLKKGDQIIIGSTTQDEIYPANYLEVYKFVKEGQKLLMGDGDVELIVDKVVDGKMYCLVHVGELLKPGKAMNIPGVEHSTETLTEKDLVNLEHAIKTGWDYVSASFMQSAQNAQVVVDAIAGRNMKIIAKIEDQQGVNNIGEILPLVDGVMIARGGLGVELGLEKVPLIQDKLINVCRGTGKPVIVATQMLESMVVSRRPTRAEVNDVALAILSKSDAVMLSAESSVGDYPIVAVQMLSTIMQEVEPAVKPELTITKPMQVSATSDALTRAAVEVCNTQDNNIDSVIIVTKTGTKAKLISRHVISQPVYVFTSTGFVQRVLSLNRGITKTFLLGDVNVNRGNAVETIIAIAKKTGVVEDGQKILILSKSKQGHEQFYPNLFEIVDV